MQGKGRHLFCFRIRKEICIYSTIALVNKELAKLSIQIKKKKKAMIYYHIKLIFPSTEETSRRQFVSFFADWLFFWKLDTENIANCNCVKWKKKHTHKNDLVRLSHVLLLTKVQLSFYVIYLS